MNRRGLSCSLADISNSSTSDISPLRPVPYQDDESTRSDPNIYFRYMNLSAQLNTPLLKPSRMLQIIPRKLLVRLGKCQQFRLAKVFADKADTGGHIVFKPSVWQRDGWVAGEVGNG